MIYVLSQVFVFLAFIISIIAYQKSTKKQILGYMALSHFLNAIHYLLLGAVSGLVARIIGVLRNVIIINKDKSKLLSSSIVMYVFITISIISGILSYTNLYSLLPIVSSVIYIFVTWNGDELAIKYVSFASYFLWILYNASVYSVIGVITNAISLISSTIAIIRERRKRIGHNM